MDMLNSIRDSLFFSIFDSLFSDNFLLRKESHPNAQMVELVDTLVSGTSDRKVVQVRVLFWVHGSPIFSKYRAFLFL